MHPCMYTYYTHVSLKKSARIYEKHVDIEVKSQKNYLYVHVLVIHESYGTISLI